MIKIHIIDKDIYFNKILMFFKHRFDFSQLIELSMNKVW